MDVTSLYTNIPQNEGIEIVCKAYENFDKNNPPTCIPTHYYVREMLRLILKENSFQFNGKHYLQTHGTAMGTKTAVSFANIFMAHIETTILSRTVFKPTVWKRYIDDIFSLWDISKPDIKAFIEQANLFKEKSILDVKTRFQKTKTFQYTHFTSCHPPSVQKGFVKGEALRILRTNSSKTTLEENFSNFKKGLIDRG